MPLTRLSARRAEAGITIAIWLNSGYSGEISGFDVTQTMLLDTKL
jgi:hypothetical protein